MRVLHIITRLIRGGAQENTVLTAAYHRSWGLDAAIAMGLSFVTAYAAIGALMAWVEKTGFLPFVIYRILLGFVLIALFGI